MFYDFKHLGLLITCNTLKRCSFLINVMAYVTYFSVCLNHDLILLQYLNE